MLVHLGLAGVGENVFLTTREMFSSTPFHRRSVLVGYAGQFNSNESMHPSQGNPRISQDWLQSPKPSIVQGCEWLADPAATDRGACIQTSTSNPSVLCIQ